MLNLLMIVLLELLVIVTCMFTSKNVKISCIKVANLFATNFGNVSMNKYEINKTILNKLFYKEKYTIRDILNNYVIKNVTLFWNDGLFCQKMKTEFYQELKS